MKQGKKNEELLKVIESVKDRTDLTWCQKLDRVLEFEKAHGMKGCHATVDPSAKDLDAEKCAEGLFKMFQAEANGDYETLEEGDVL